MASERPRIEFPCTYPVKVVGAAGDDFRAFVEATVERHAPGFDRALTTARASRAGNWLAVTVTITATGEAQLQALFDDFKRSGRVQMVL